MNLRIRCAMESLPDEIMILIFDHASTYDLTTSLQYVCSRWNYLINTSERIWRGDVRLKGLTEERCGSKLCHVLRRTPRLKYLQIGNPHPRAPRERWTEDARSERSCGDRTDDILDTISRFNVDIEYLQIVDAIPATDSLLAVINRPKFKRLTVVLDRLCDRREKIRDLRKVFDDVPEIDNLCINFSQRIRFECEKEDSSKWSIIHNFKTDVRDEFS